MQDRMTIQKLLELDREIVHLKHISALLLWDEVVLMPKASAKERGEQVSLINIIIHDKLTKEMPKFLSVKPRNKVEEKIIERYKWICSKAEKLPKSYVEELSKTLSASHHAWEKAREYKDFNIFKPYLEKVVALKRREAEYLKSKGKSEMQNKKIHPYEILLQDYERGMTVESLDKTFRELKNGIIRIMKKGKKTGSKINVSIPEDIQKELVQDIATMILEDNKRFLIAQSVHPFMTTISYNDLRITTAIRTDPFFALSSTVHESGHALYESQFDKRYMQTILQDAPSMGIHESQSRIWENQICKSKEFWRFYAKKLSKYPELKKYSWQDYYKSFNHFKPSLIRIESDELTYCLHIIIRYELEKQLIEGSLKVKNLPEAWNKKYKEYLGVTIKNDSEGVMQDTHWADGLFGYFPTYALGSIYSAMIYDAMKKKFDIKKDILKGDFSRIKHWLKKNIHTYGYFYLTKEIIQKSCNTTMDITPFLKYLEEKFN